MILSILLERIKTEEYEVTEEGVYDKEDNVYIDLIRLKLKTSNEYIVICHKPGEERPYIYLPKIIFGEETMDEFYEILREKQREKKLGDKWEMILYESLILFRPD